MLRIEIEIEHNRIISKIFVGVIKRREGAVELAARGGRVEVAVRGGRVDRGARGLSWDTSTPKENTMNSKARHTIHEVSTLIFYFLYKLIEKKQQQKRDKYRGQHSRESY